MDVFECHGVAPAGDRADTAVLLSDLILTMTEGHKQILEPLAKGKVYTLLEYAGSSGDISDPYGGDLEEYEEVAQEIYDALVDVAEKIADMQSKK